MIFSSLMGTAETGGNWPEQMRKMRQREENSQGRLRENATTRRKLSKEVNGNAEKCR